MREIAEAGTEIWTPWARRQLLQLMRLRHQLGLPVMQKRVSPDSGTSVALYTSDWGDEYRITGGTALVEYDPFHELWGIKSALMPWTRPELTPSLAYGPTVQHISAFYPTKYPATPGVPAEYVRRHWLVICRYCQRVAEYTWDEVAKAVPNPYFDPNKPVHFDTNPELLPVLSGEYVSHLPDGSQVTTRATTTEGVVIIDTVAISPSLEVLSDGEPYGWIESYDDPLHPGPEPVPPQTEDYFTYANYYSLQVPGTGLGGFGALFYNDLAGFQVWNYDTGTWTDLGPTGPPSGYVPGPPGTPPHEDASPIGATWTGAQEIAALHSAGYGAGPNDRTPGINAAFDAAEAAYQAALAARCDALLAKANLVYTSVLSKMDEKKFTDVDLEELRPYPLATNHNNQKQALVVSAYSKAELTLSCGGDKANIPFNSAALRLTDMPTNIYGVTIALADPNIPAPPSTPWEVTVSGVTAFDYKPGTKTFAHASSTPSFKHALFSKGVAPPLIMGQTMPVKYTGFARVSGAEQGFPVREGDALDALMRRLCVAILVPQDLAYVVVYSIRSSASAAAYRATEHAHSNIVGGKTYSFTQPAIEPNP